MTAAFFITLREGLEAALIVGHHRGLPGQVGRRDALRGVWIGVGAALALSVVVGVARRRRRSVACRSSCRRASRASPRSSRSSS